MPCLNDYSKYRKRVIGWKINNSKNWAVKISEGIVILQFGLKPREKY